MANSIFDKLSLSNLVSFNRETNLKEVNQTLKDTDRYGSNLTGIACYICGKDASHRVIPRKGVPTSAFLQDKGYICSNCLDMKYLDSERYGIREIEK